MRAALPFILIFLALFTGACIVYIAWELTSDRPGRDKSRPGDSNRD